MGNVKRTEVTVWLRAKGETPALFPVRYSVTEWDKQSRNIQWGAAVVAMRNEWEGYWLPKTLRKKKGGDGSAFRGRAARYRGGREVETRMFDIQIEVGETSAVAPKKTKTNKQPERCERTKEMFK